MIGKTLVNLPGSAEGYWTAPGTMHLWLFGMVSLKEVQEHNIPCFAVAGESSLMVYSLFLGNFPNIRRLNDIWRPTLECLSEDGRAFLDSLRDNLALTTPAITPEWKLFAVINMGKCSQNGPETATRN